MICKILRISHHTLRSIEEREPRYVATDKKRLSAMGRLCVERIINEIEEILRQSLAVLR